MTSMKNFFEIQDALLRASLGNITNNIKSIYYQMPNKNNELNLIVFTKNQLVDEDDEYMQILMTEFESFFAEPLVCKTNYYIFSNSENEKEVLSAYKDYHGLFLLK